MYLAPHNNVVRIWCTQMPATLSTELSTPFYINIWINRSERLQLSADTKCSAATATAADGNSNGRKHVPVVLYRWSPHPHPSEQTRWTHFASTVRRLCSSRVVRLRFGGGGRVPFNYGQLSVRTVDCSNATTCRTMFGHMCGTHTHEVACFFQIKYVNCVSICMGHEFPLQIPIHHRILTIFV